MQQTNSVETTLFMLMSADGKISTGATDELDVDKDFSRIVGIKEGLEQYYQIEQMTELHSLNTGRVMAKIGINSRCDTPTKSPVSFFIVDRKPHLNESGIVYLCKWLKTLFVITNNKNHPAIKMQRDFQNLKVIFYDNEIDFVNLMSRINIEFGVERLTIQSGGSLNAILLRHGLIDHIDVVVSPALIGGKETSTLIDGYSLNCESDLKYIKALKLTNCEVLKNSYIRIKYDVIKETLID